MDLGYRNKKSPDSLYERGHFYGEGSWPLSIKRKTPYGRHRRARSPLGGSRQIAVEEVFLSSV
jgi:hypothetical protein